MGDVDRPVRRGAPTEYSTSGSARAAGDVAGGGLTAEAIGGEPMGSWRITGFLKTTSNQPGTVRPSAMDRIGSSFEDDFKIQRAGGPPEVGPDSPRRAWIATVYQGPGLRLRTNT